MYHKCPCCGHLTIDGRLGDICPVCFWELDGVTSCNAPSGANHGLTLTQAKKNFKQFHACEISMIPYVRAAKPYEKI